MGSKPVYLGKAVRPYRRFAARWPSALWQADDRALPRLAGPPSHHYRGDEFVSYRASFPASSFVRAHASRAARSGRSVNRNGLRCRTAVGIIRGPGIRRAYRHPGSVGCRDGSDRPFPFCQSCCSTGSWSAVRRRPAHAGGASSAVLRRSKVTRRYDAANARTVLPCGDDVSSSSTSALLPECGRGHGGPSAETGAAPLAPLPARPPFARAEADPAILRGFHRAFISWLPLRVLRVSAVSD